MIDFQQIIEYLCERVFDPVPAFIMQKEILKTPAASPGYVNANEQMRQSKWYRELAGEQWDDGSWGRFHSMDSKATVKQRFATTEDALKRARQLSLTKDDPVVAKCIALMERYVRGEETWRDNIEKHKDGGKSHLRAPFEGTFSKQNKRVRYRGVVKNQGAEFLYAMAFNFRRLLVLNPV